MIYLLFKCISTRLTKIQRSDILIVLFNSSYFSPRLPFKGLVRQSRNDLRICVRNFHYFDHLPIMVFQIMNMEIAQHHDGDAVIGTAKQHVSDDHTSEVTKESLDVLISFPMVLDHLESKISFVLNLSQCNATEKNGTKVTLYNPHSIISSCTVRFPVLKGT